jgi:predicted DNA-binding protein YlxM (UPF0122 family)
MKAKINRTHTMLVAFRNKAGCLHTQYRAKQLYRELQALLTKEEYIALSTAYSHYQLGEGANELYSVCAKLEDKYKA